MLASLSVMHGFLPPHPSPMALVTQFNADLVKTFTYGLIVAIPAIIIAGPIFAKALINMQSRPTVTLQADELPDNELPGITNSVVSALLPVLIILGTTLITRICNDNIAVLNFARFTGDPTIAMILTICIATYTLGMRLGKKLIDIMVIFVDATKDIAMILLIIGSAGILKQVFVETGVSNSLAAILQGLTLPPLLLAWLITAVLRLCLGSATVAGLTAAGIVYPLIGPHGADPNLMVLAVGSGSLFCSHVNDSSFWLFKEYLGLSIKQTFLSWSLMETLVSVIGLIGILIINQVLFR